MELLSATHIRILDFHSSDIMRRCDPELSERKQPHALHCYMYPMFELYKVMQVVVKSENVHV